MSNAAREWAKRQGLRGWPHAVLVSLADRANDAGLCWPGLALIATDTGCCERTARSALRRLEALGKVATWQSKGRKSSTYALLMGAGEPAAEPEPTRQDLPGSPPPTRQPVPPNLQASRTIKEEERGPAPQATPLSPALPTMTIAIPEAKEARRIEVADPSPAKRQRLPEDFEPSPEECAEARAAGLDPAEIREELRDWALAGDHRLPDWHAQYRRFVRAGKAWIVSRRPKSAGQDHGARASELLARVRANFAAGLMA